MLPLWAYTGPMGEATMANATDSVLPADAIQVGTRRGEEIYYSRSQDMSYIVSRSVFGSLRVRRVRGKIAGCCG